MTYCKRISMLFLEYFLFSYIFLFFLWGGLYNVHCTYIVLLNGIFHWEMNILRWTRMFSPQNITAIAIMSINCLITRTLSVYSVNPKKVEIYHSFVMSVLYAFPLCLYVQYIGKGEHFCNQSQCKQKNLDEMHTSCLLYNVHMHRIKQN